MTEQDTEQGNVEILRRTYSAYHERKGDPDVWLSILADHVDWQSVADGKPGMEFARPRATKAEVAGYFEDLFADWQMHYYLINEFVANGDRVVALGECSWTYRKTGKRAAAVKADVFRFQDGKIVEFMEFFDTHTVMNAMEP